MEKKFVSMTGYDGTVVKVPSDKMSEFKKTQEYIKKELAKGKTLQEILLHLKKESN